MRGQGDKRGADLVLSRLDENHKSGFFISFIFIYLFLYRLYLYNIMYTRLFELYNNVDGRIWCGRASTRIIGGEWLR